MVTGNSVKDSQARFGAMNRTGPSARLAFIFVVAMLFVVPLPALAQSCAFCYTQAASAGGRMIEALKSGILILIVPPTLMSIAMVCIMYRNRSRCRDAASTVESKAARKTTVSSIAATNP